MNKKKSFWIWNYGEYEIYHSMLVHTRRQEFGADFPTNWKMPSPCPTVRYIKRFECSKAGYMKGYTNGNGFIRIDGKTYSFGEKIIIEPGEHTTDVRIYKTDGLPAIYIESDVCPTDKSWKANNGCGQYLSVGCEEVFDSVEKTPEIFPFAYERKYSVKKEIRDDGVLYDFGIESFGLLNISYSYPQEEVRVYYGESLEEATDIDNTIVFEFLMGSKEYRLRPRAFRYVFIKCKNPDEISVDMDYEFLPLEKKGNFKCDRELFNTIYEACAYTFHLNCREVHLDGIKRDRWAWAGDTYQSNRINSYLFGDEAVDRRSALAFAGNELFVQHLNTITDYSLLWIIGLYEYYLRYENIEYMRRIFEKALLLMDFCEKRLDENGFIIGKEGDWIFIDWTSGEATIDRQGPISAEQMLLVGAYRSMTKLGEILGVDIRKYADKEACLIKRINDFYWNDELGAFIDSYQSGKNHITRHANIFAVMYDIATPLQTEKIIKNVLNNDKIPQITTPYFEGYELDVFGKTKNFEAIEKKLTSYWGGMIELGAKTIWEEFYPQMQGIEHYAMYGKKYGKSLCHAWGASPVYLFGRYYLGVYPTSAGYSTFRVEPNLGGLGEIKGTVPVNGGTVSVELNKELLKVKTDKKGGTLLWDKKEYELEVDKELVISL